MMYKSNAGDGIFKHLIFSNALRLSKLVNMVGYVKKYVRYSDCYV